MKTANIDDIKCTFISPLTDKVALLLVVVVVVLGLQSQPHRHIDSCGVAGDDSHDFSRVQEPYPQCLPVIVYHLCSMSSLLPSRREQGGVGGGALSQQGSR